MDEPSNQTPLSSASGKRPEGIVTLFTVPMMSVNCRLIKITPSAFASSITSFASTSSSLLNCQLFCSRSVKIRKIMARENSTTLAIDKQIGKVLLINRAYLGQC
jgi:hypothetical protein